MEHKAYSEYVSDFLDFMQRVSTGYPAEQQQVELMEAQTQDILHELELESHSGPEMVLLAKALRDVRRERRLAKDNVVMLKPLADWAEKYKNVTNSLKNALGAERKAEAYVQERAYYGRTDIVQKTLRKAEEEAETEEVEKNNV